MAIFPFGERHTIFKDSLIPCTQYLDKVIEYYCVVYPAYKAFAIKDEDLGYKPMKPSLQSKTALNQKPRVIPPIPVNALLWTDNGRAPLIEFEEKVL